MSGKKYVYRIATGHSMESSTIGVCMSEDESYGICEDHNRTLKGGDADPESWWVSKVPLLSRKKVYEDNRASKCKQKTQMEVKHYPLKGKFDSIKRKGRNG